jgi:hypothetical protein
VNGVPVYVNPILMKDEVGSTAFGDKMSVGIDEVNYVQNPVVNPPFNNWSVNQPAVPHDHGMRGDEDLGQDAIVDGHKIHYAQRN